MMVKHGEQVYDLTVYACKEHRRLDGIVTFKFVVSPHIRMVETVVQRGKVESKLMPKVKDVTEALRAFIFKKTTSPVIEDDNILWDLSPGWTEDDKKSIKRQFLLEEL